MLGAINPKLGGVWKFGLEQMWAPLTYMMKVKLMEVLIIVMITIVKKLCYFYVSTYFGECLVLRLVIRLKTLPTRCMLSARYVHTCIRVLSVVWLWCGLCILVYSFVLLFTKSH